MFTLALYTQQKDSLSNYNAVLSAVGTLEALYEVYLPEFAVYTERHIDFSNLRWAIAFPQRSIQDIQSFPDMVVIVLTKESAKVERYFELFKGAVRQGKKVCLFFPETVGLVFICNATGDYFEVNTPEWFKQPLVPKGKVSESRIRWRKEISKLIPRMQITKGDYRRSPWSQVYYASPEKMLAHVGKLVTDLMEKHIASFKGEIRKTLQSRLVYAITKRAGGTRKKGGSKYSEQGDSVPGFVNSVFLHKDFRQGEQQYSVSALQSAFKRGLEYFGGSKSGIKFTGDRSAFESDYRTYLKSILGAFGDLLHKGYPHYDPVVDKILHEVDMVVVPPVTAGKYHSGVYNTLPQVVLGKYMIDVVNGYREMVPKIVDQMVEYLEAALEESPKLKKIPSQKRTQEEQDLLKSMRELIGKLGGPKEAQKFLVSLKEFRKYFNNVSHLDTVKMLGVKEFEVKNALVYPRFSEKTGRIGVSRKEMLFDYMRKALDYMEKLDTGDVDESSIPPNLRDMVEHLWYLKEDIKEKLQQKGGKDLTFAVVDDNATSQSATMSATALALRYLNDLAKYEAGFADSKPDVNQYLPDIKGEMNKLRERVAQMKSRGELVTETTNQIREEIKRIFHLDRTVGEVPYVKYGDGKVVEDPVVVIQRWKTDIADVSVKEQFSLNWDVYKVERYGKKVEA